MHLITYLDSASVIPADDAIQVRDICLVMTRVMNLNHK